MRPGAVVGLLGVLGAAVIGAVAFYQWGLRADVVKPMLAGAGPDGALLGRATAFLAAAAGIVYMLVVVYPSR